MSSLGPDAARPSDKNSVSKLADGVLEASDSSFEKIQRRHWFRSRPGPIHGNVRRQRQSEAGSYDGNAGLFPGPGRRNRLGSQCRRMLGSFSSEVITLLASRCTLWATARQYLFPGLRWKSVRGDPSRRASGRLHPAPQSPAPPATVWEWIQGSATIGRSAGAEGLGALLSRRAVQGSR